MAWQIGVSDTDQSNWEQLVDSVSDKLKEMTTRNLTLKGKAVMLNSVILSKLWYKAAILGIPRKYLSKLNKVITKFMWNDGSPLISRETLELKPHRGGIKLVNISNKLKAMKVKHILDLIYGEIQHPWKSLARYWIGLKLKTLNVVQSQIIDWRGPFAETPNEFYQQCFEIFKVFIQLIDGTGIRLCRIPTKIIYSVFQNTKQFYAKVIHTYPHVNFFPIFKNGFTG